FSRDWSSDVCSSDLVWVVKLTLTSLAPARLPMAPRTVRAHSAQSMSDTKYSRVAAGVAGRSLMVRGLYHLYTWADVEYVGRPPAQAPARYRRRARRAGGRARETTTPTRRLARANAHTRVPEVAGAQRTTSPRVLPGAARRLYAGAERRRPGARHLGVRHGHHAAHASARRRTHHAQLEDARPREHAGRGRHRVPGSRPAKRAGGGAGRERGEPDHRGAGGEQRALRRGCAGRVPDGVRAAARGRVAAGVPRPDRQSVV